MLDLLGLVALLPFAGFLVLTLAGVPKRYAAVVGAGSVGLSAALSLVIAASFLISPPAGWYHQHFNTGAEPVFHLAFHRPASINDRSERGQIEYEDEDPKIRQMFEQNLAHNGVQIDMPKFDGSSDDED